MSASGVRCTECGHVRRTYRRRLPKPDLDTLARLYGLTSQGETWVHISRIKRHRSGCGFAKLRYWGLIEERSLEGEDKKNSGYWRLTLDGFRFMAGRSRIPTHAVIENGELVELDGPRVDVHAAFRMCGFSFAELMAPFDNVLL